MYVQLFLGIAMLLTGIGHYWGRASLIRRSIRTFLDVKTLKSFQKSLVLPYTWLGITFIAMGLVEKAQLFPGAVYIILYVILVSFPIILVLKNNKKYLDRYF